MSKSIITKNYSSYANYLGANRCCELRGVGPVGPAGAQGAQGAIGLGIQGAQGDQGSTGSTGPIGYQGTIGSSGLDSGYGFLLANLSDIYEFNTALPISMTSANALGYGKKYAINISVFINSSIDITNQGVNVTCNIQPNTSSTTYLTPQVFGNNGSDIPTVFALCNSYSITPQPPPAPPIIPVYYLSCSFTDYFQFDQAILSGVPFNVNIYLNQSGTLIDLTNFTINASATLFPVSV